LERNADEIKQASSEFSFKQRLKSTLLKRVLLNTPLDCFFLMIIFSTFLQYCSLVLFHFNLFCSIYFVHVISGAGKNLKVEGHNMPARRAGRKFFDVPLHFSVVSLWVRGHNEK